MTKQMLLKSDISELNQDATINTQRTGKLQLFSSALTTAVPHTLKTESASPDSDRSDQLHLFKQNMEAQVNYIKLMLDTQLHCIKFWRSTFLKRH